MENIKARVIAQHRGLYKIKSENGELLAKITGKQMFTAQSPEDYPAVGDWVLAQELGAGQAVIKSILPRKSIIKIKSQVVATNIDTAFVVQSVGRDFNLNRFERYFAILQQGNVRPAIVLNKIDLISLEELEVILEKIKNRFPKTDVFSVSSINEKGIEQFKNYLEKDKTFCFLGSSGVGKSSLINKLLGKDLIKTDQISLYSNRGKHITTTRQMYFLPNEAVVIDNPGLREVGVAVEGEAIDNTFFQITELAQKCKFTDCTHASEPGCQVLLAVESGKVDKKQYENYLNLKKESDFYKMSELEKKEKERDFGKFVNKAKKSFKKYSPKI